MPAILVNDVSPVISYTATAGQTLFSVPFEFFAVQDIVVERAGVTLTYSPTPANNNQFSVIGANLEGGGSITLGSPGATLGDKIVIFRDVAIERLANYPETGPMAVRSLNAEQAKHIAMMQQLERDIGRSVTVPIGESSVDIPTAAVRANKYLFFDNVGNPQVSNGVSTDPSLRLELAASAGSALVGFSHASTYAAGTLGAKLKEAPSIKDAPYNAVGDGIANDTNAILAAVAYMESTGNPVFVPPGTYLTDPFQTKSPSYAAQGFFFGNEAASTIIKRRGTGAGAFITIGDVAATVFQAQIIAKGIMIDGGPVTNGPACLMYDVVRSRFEGVIFSGGSIAMNSKGGITNTFDGCTFQLAGQGFKIENFASATGGGFPNANRLTNCQIVDNTVWGGVFDGGMVLFLSGCQIEGNGTTLGAVQGGILVGLNIGTEISVVDPTAMGVVISGCWFESNKGTADIWLQSGINSVSDTNFYSIGTGITNDIKIDGGRYRLRNLNMGHAKTANVLEGASVTTGNIIEYVDASALSFNSTKTAVNQGYRSFLGNGAVPGINGATAPLIQTGTDSSGVNPTITFNQAFKAATVPRVYVSTVNNSATTIEEIDVYSVSNTAFTMRKKSFNGTTISTSNYSVSWTAFGENP